MCCVPRRRNRKRGNLNCPHCKAPEQDLVKHRTTKYSTLRIYCKACEKWFTNFDAPKVLLFDIETSRVKVETDLWSSQLRREVYLNYETIKADWFILGWSGKWLFEPDVFGDIVKPKEARERNDKRVTTSLHKVIQKADCVITHNGNKFDIKKINWRFLMHYLPPVQRYKSIDTLARCKEVFGASSLAMDFLCQQLGYDGKHDTDKKLWVDCEAGDAKALQSMFEYNKNDVYMLEDLYLRTRPYMKTHPNFSAFVQMYQPLKADEYQCPRCLQVVHESKFGKRWQSPAGYFYKTATCPECGTMLRKTVREPNQMIGVR